MSQSALYDALKEKWNTRLSLEPESWNQEREQYISLLNNEKIEEFFLLVCDQPTLFCSLFEKNEYGHLDFDEEIQISSLQRLLFIQAWFFCSKDAPPLSQLLHHSPFEPFVLKAFGRHTTTLQEEEEALLLQYSQQMLVVPKGECTMGALDADESAQDCERPAHLVHVQDMLVGKYPVSQVLWKYVMRRNPSHFQGWSRPVENITWYEAISFCNTLSEMEGLTPVYTLKKEPPKKQKRKTTPRTTRNNRGRKPTPKNTQKAYKTIQEDPSANGYRLLREGEWEYCARANQNTLYSGSDFIDDVAWYSLNTRSDWSDLHSKNETQSLGQKTSNSWGFFDMSGNVWEYVFDAWWLYDTPKTKKTKAERPIQADQSCVIRGGCWSRAETYARVSSRKKCGLLNRGNGIGFRIARTQT